MKTSETGPVNASLYRSRQLEMRSGGSQLVSPLYLEKAAALARKFTNAEDRRLVMRAYDLAWNGHLHQRRKQGIAFIAHPLSVAETMVKWGGSAEEVAACLCHDLIEVGRLDGQRVTQGMIAARLNERVAAIVNGVTEPGTEPGARVTNPTLAEIWSHYLGEGQKYPSVFKVKLADRFNNMCTLAYTERRSHRAKAEETLYIYCRIADRLGMWQVKRQLEDICFRYLRPARYGDLLARCRLLVADSLPSIQAASYRLDKVFRAVGLSVGMQMEKRAVYELWGRIMKRNLSEIGPADIWRLLINLRTPGPDGCNCALRELLSNFSTLPAETSDFILLPLANGHRFLQTVLTGLPFDLTVQIRDPDMLKDYKIGTPEQDFAWVTELRGVLQTPNLGDEDLYQLFARYTAD